MTALVIWMLTVFAPHGEVKMLGGFQKEETCKEASAEIEKKLKDQHVIATCVAYIPRDAA
jgi:hypothetical protein